MAAWIPVLCAALPFVAGSLYFHFRGRLRFKLRRQLGDYSTLLSPYNAFAALCTKGGSRPVHDTAERPELRLLRENWQVIRDEALALMQDGQVRRTDREDDVVFHSFMKRGWKRFYLQWYRGPLPSARRLCPRTVALLEQLPTVHGAMFTVLEPHSRLGKHRDPFAGTLRYHLGLSTPNSDDCRLLLDGQLLSWRDGQDLLFDSSYVHGARNDTDAPRVVLFCDVERPMRGRVSGAINRFFVKRVVPVTQVPNLPGDPVGLGNRLFLALRPVRSGIRTLKERTPALYYGLQYAVPLALLAWLVWP